MSGHLKDFLVRGRRRGRKILDRLILAYATSGFNAEKTVEAASIDYETVPDVPSLSKEDIAIYHSFFWNFGGLIDLEAGKRWIRRHFPDSDEERIVSGDLSPSSVRAKVGATGGFDMTKSMERIAQKSSRAIERCLAEVNAVDRSYLLKGGHGGSNANMRNTAAMVSSLLPVVSSFYESKTAEGEEGKPMGEYMDERLASVIEEARDFEEHYGDWRETHQGNTVEDLLEETKNVQQQTPDETPAETDPNETDSNKAGSNGVDLSKADDAHDKPDSSKDSTSESPMSESPAEDGLISDLID